MDSAGGPMNDLAVESEADLLTLDELLEAATGFIARYEPAEAQAAIESGALLVDIRSELDRERDGVVPGSIHIPRTVLEWRLAGDGPWRNPHAAGRRLILLCDHGCSTILAGATLAQLGVAGVGDVIGGFAAWRETGLPTVPAPPVNRAPGEPAGMGAPDT
jgi:rhodanese-related sulfurtransferase